MHLFIGYGQLTQQVARNKVDIARVDDFDQHVQCIPTRKFSGNVCSMVISAFRAMVVSSVSLATKMVSLPGVKAEVCMESLTFPASTSCCVTT